MIYDLTEIDGKLYPTQRDATPKELAEANLPAENIKSLKKQLAETDYKAIKYAEGWISEEDYAPIKEQRQAIRDRINELEGKNELEHRN